MQERINVHDNETPDKDSYVVIWEEIIDREIRAYENKFFGHTKRIPFAQNAIWEKYVEYNTHCKIHYMKNPNERIDRHKVAACYMLAIASVSPIRFDISSSNSSDKHSIVNELLAITVGLSILRAFILYEIDESNKDEKAKKFLKERLSSGIKTPNEQYVHHGKYEVNFANELYYSLHEGKDNILSIAHELFLLELFTLYADET